MKNQHIIMISLIIFKNHPKSKCRKYNSERNDGILIESDTSTINFEDKKPKIKNNILIEQKTKYSR
jgi:hypothetical protein